MNAFPAALARVLLAGAASLSLTLVHAQTVEWSGANSATSTAWGQGANWVGGTAPTAGANIRIATGTFLSPDTMAFNADRTAGSITFDNTAGQFPSVLRLNANVGTGTTTRNVTLNGSGGLLLNLANSAQVQIWGNSSGTGTSTTLNLLLGYNGTANLHVDATSSLGLFSGANLKATTGNTSAVAKTGDGTLTIGSGAGNFTGGFTLAAGTVLLGSNTSNSSGAVTQGAFGTGTLTLSGGTTLASNSTAARTIDNALVFTGGTVTLGNATNNGTLTFAAAVGQATLQGNTVLNVESTVGVGKNLTGAFSLTKTGDGTLTLSGNGNSYSGGTILQGGMLQLQSSDKLPTDGDVTFDGGILRISTAGFTSSNHTTTVTANGGTFNIAGGNNLVWTGNISGAGAITNAGSGSTGVLTLTGTNTYAGATTITTGTLNLGTGGTTGSLTGDIANSGTVNFNRSNAYTYSGSISGNGTVNHLGTGTLTFTGNHTYTGPTGISDGTFVQNGTLASAVTVGGNATLSGNGLFTGAVTIDGGVHAPGTSPGTQTFADLTYNGGSSVIWELAANTTSGAGTNFDRIIVNGTLNFAGATTLSLSFNDPGSTVNWGDSFWSSNHTWLVYDPSALTNFSNLTLATLNWQDSIGQFFNTALAGSSFALSNVGNDVFLTYTSAIPEPSTYAALLGLAALGGAWWHRRRRTAIRPDAA